MKENNKYVVRICNEGGQFFADENNESCDGSQDYFIDNLNTAKQVYAKNNNGNIELQEYDGSDDWEHYVVLESK